MKNIEFCAKRLKHVIIDMQYMGIHVIESPKMKSWRQQPVHYREVMSCYRILPALLGCDIPATI